MKVIFKQSFRNVLKSKLTGLFVIFSLAISIIILYLNISVTSSIIKNYEMLLRSVYGNVDISVMSQVPFDYKGTYLNGLREEQVIKVFKINVKMQGNTMDADEQSSVRFADLKKCENYSLINLKSGSLENMKQDSIVISEKFSMDNNLVIGDDLKIKYNEKEYIFTIAAIASTSGIYSLGEESRTIFANYDYIHNILQSDTDMAMVSGLFIGLDDSQNIDDICTTLQENNKSLIIRKNINSDELSNSMKSFNQIMLFVFILSTLLNLFIVYSVLKLILLKRLPVIASYRSLGATKFFAFQLICSENFIYAFIAWIIGMVIAPNMRNIIINNYFGISNKAITNISFSTNIFYAFICFAFMAIILTVTTIIITHKNKKMSIKEALFDKVSTQLKVSAFQLVFGILLVGISFTIIGFNNNYDIVLSIIGIIMFFLGTAILIIPLYVFIIRAIKKLCDKFLGAYVRLSLNSISQNKNIAGVIQMTAITLAFIFTIFILLSSISTMFYEVSSSSKVDYRISNLGNHYDTILAEVKECAEEVYVDYYTEVKLNENKNIILLGYGEEICSWTDSIEIPSISLKNNEIILDEYFATKNNLAIGDNVSLRNEHISIGTYKITGMLNSYKWNTFRNVAVVNLDEYVEKFSHVPSDISIRVGIKENVKEKLEGIVSTNKVTLTNMKESLEYQKLATDRLLKSVMVLLIVCIFLGFVGIINNQILTMLNRRREIAIKYSVAMNKRNIIGAFLLETCIVFFIICLLAVAISMGMIYFSENVLYSAGIPMIVGINLESVVKFVASTLFIFVINSMIPIKVVKSTNIVAEIRTE